MERTPTEWKGTIRTSAWMKTVGEAGCMMAFPISILLGKLEKLRGEGFKTNESSNCHQRKLIPFIKSHQL